MQTERPRRMRKKVCGFCMEKIEYIDYKDVNKLRKYISENAKINPRRMTGVCAKHQRKVAKRVMTERWENNNHRKVNGIKRTPEEKKAYQKEYYKKHKQFASVEYKLDN